jgi:hypothetical protein
LKITVLLRLRERFGAPFFFLWRARSVDPPIFFFSVRKLLACSGTIWFVLPVCILVCLNVWFRWGVVIWFDPFHELGTFLLSCTLNWFANCMRWPSVLRTVWWTSFVILSVCV